MNHHTHQIAASALVLAVSAAVYGQEKQANPASAAPKASPAKSQVNPVNKWLRGQSESFNAWDIGGQFRARYELKENAGSDGSYSNEDFMKSPPAGKFNDNTFLYLREKVHIGYTPTPWFSAFVQGRDSSSTGDRRNPNPGADQFDLHQAYVTVGNAKEFPITAKVGRQEFLYGDERIVGVGDWGNLGRSFDAAKVRFESKGVWVDAFVGRLVMPDNHNLNMPNDYDFLSGVYASTTAIVPTQETQFYFVAHNASIQSSVRDPGWISSPSKAQDVYTTGVRIKSLPGKVGDWDYTGELAGQFGNVNPSGTKRYNQEALSVMVAGGYTFKKAPLSPRVGIGYDFASGDKDANDDRNQTFEPVFPTNHKVYGYMDVVGSKNIHNPRLSVSVKPAKTVSVTLDYHLFWLADVHDYYYSESGTARRSNGYGINPGYSSFVGSEIDLDVTWNIKPWATLRAGCGHFFVGDYVKSSLAARGGATDADWVYVQTVINF